MGTFLQQSAEHPGRPALLAKCNQCGADLSLIGPGLRPNHDPPWPAERSLGRRMLGRAGWTYTSDLATTHCADCMASAEPPAGTRRCEYCEGRKRAGGVACPKCDGQGHVPLRNPGSCLNPHAPAPDTCTEAEVMRMKQDPTYRPLIDGPAASPVTGSCPSSKPHGLENCYQAGGQWEGPGHREPAPVTDLTVTGTPGPGGFRRIDPPAAEPGTTKGMAQITWQYDQAGGHHLELVLEYGEPPGSAHLFPGPGGWAVMVMDEDNEVLLTKHLESKCVEVARIDGTQALVEWLLAGRPRD